MKHARDAAKELPEMLCEQDVIYGSSIATERNCLRYIYLYVTSDVHVHETCESIFGYLYSVRNGNILSKRAHTEVLEDRRGNARNKLRESTYLEWLQ